MAWTANDARAEADPHPFHNSGGAGTPHTFVLKEWKVTPWWLRKLFCKPMFRSRSSPPWDDYWIYSNWPGPENTEGNL